MTLRGRNRNNKINVLIAIAEYTREKEGGKKGVGGGMEAKGGEPK